MDIDADALVRLAPIFGRLSPEDRARLAAASRAKTFARGETILTEGEPAGWFITIAAGRVKVFKMTPTGKDIILEILAAGDPLGAVALYEDRPYPASAVALENTTALLIPRNVFFALLEQHPTLVRGLLAGLTHRLMDLTSRLAELTGGRVEPRFARLFLKLAGEQGRPDRGGIFVPVPLSRQELADMTGTTVETCIRIMSRWGKQRIVLTEKDGFVVVNRAELDALSLT